MDFEKPKKVVDVTKALKLSALALAKLQFQDPVTNAQDFYAIWEVARGEIQSGPQHIAWAFLANCVATATATVLRQPRLRCELTDEEIAELAARSVEKLPDSGTITSDDLTNLALSASVADCIANAPTIINEATTEHGLNDQDLIRLYSDALWRSVTAVFQRQTTVFGDFVTALAAPTTQPEIRDFAWKRHGAWIRSMFREEPIFSPKNDIDIPLSHVYQRLRCIWNEEHVTESADEHNTETYRTATVARLHESVSDWLHSSPNDDAIRLIAGGPGSGKSSFAKAFSSELVQSDTHRVLFLRLQHIRMSGTLRESIGRYLKNIHGRQPPQHCEGFPANPLDWHGEDHKPLLIVCDGLDELTANIDRESDLTRQFVSNLKNIIRDLNVAGQAARAIVLGRDLSIDAALKEADIPLECLLHVAPIRPIEMNDLRLKDNQRVEISDENSSLVSDPDDLMQIDSRVEYWKRWRGLQAIDSPDVPQAITDPRMSDLNVEPLLLHLLIISDYCERAWEEAKENRNLVYKNILSIVFERNKRKQLDAYKSLEEKHFFELMEVFGLAAFRNNGRTGDHEEFARLRKLYASRKNEKKIYESLDGASLKNVALMVHSRPDIEGAGFEFVHKSFGEYLAARALIGIGLRFNRQWHSDEFEGTEQTLALNWVDMIGTGKMSKAVLRFLRDESRLQKAETANQVVHSLSTIFDWTLVHGFPANTATGLKEATYREVEHRQRSAETCFLCTLTSLWAGLPRGKDLLPVQVFKKMPHAALDMIGRLFHKTELVPSFNAQLLGFDLSHSNLFFTSISNADFTNVRLDGALLMSSRLEGARLFGASLRAALLDGATLVGARLVAARLDGAVLDGARLDEARLDGATLDRARLRATNLNGARLDGATFESTDLRGCHMDGTSLRSVDFTEAINLTQSQVDASFGVKQGFGKTLLPDDLTYPDHWHIAEEAETDSLELIAAYDFTRNLWRTKRA